MKWKQKVKNEWHGTARRGRSSFLATEFKWVVHKCPLWLPDNGNIHEIQACFVLCCVCVCVYMWACGMDKFRPACAHMFLLMWTRVSVHVFSYVCVILIATHMNMQISFGERMCSALKPTLHCWPNFTLQCVCVHMCVLLINAFCRAWETVCFRQRCASGCACEMFLWEFMRQ